MKKKLLFLSPLPPPYYGSAVSSWECLGILEESKNFNVKNIQLNYSKNMSDVGKVNFNKIVGILRVSIKIISIRKEDFNVVYFVPALTGMGLYRDTFFVGLCRFFLRKKMIFHIRERINNEQWENPLWKLLYKINFKNSDVIVLDNTLKQDLRGVVEDKRIKVLPNAIKNTLKNIEFKKIMSNRLKQKNFNILFYSNMDRTKGWPKLLQSCKILNEKGINFKCTFVGAWLKDTDKEYFYEFIKKNNLQKKVFSVGRKTGEERDNILKNSSVLVFPTEYRPETFGRVVIEAMMFGLPVVANGIAAIPNIIRHGKTGFVLERNSPKEIASYIIKLQDKKLRKKMGEEGRLRFLKEYEIRRYSKNFKKILSDI